MRNDTTGRDPVPQVGDGEKGIETRVDERRRRRRRGGAVYRL